PPASRSTRGTRRWPTSSSRSRNCATTASISSSCDAARRQRTASRRRAGSVLRRGRGHRDTWQYHVSPRRRIAFLILLRFRDNAYTRTSRYRDSNDQGGDGGADFHRRHVLKVLSGHLPSWPDAAIP